MKGAGTIGRVTTVTHVFTTPHKGMGSTDRTGHEQVAFCQDTRSGLKAIIAIYSTALGPALGGTRFYPYGSENEALSDVLRLSAAMAYKNALAGLDHGGGKAVIIGDPAELKTEALLRAYGRFISSLSGRLPPRLTTTGPDPGRSQRIRPGRSPGQRGTSPGIFLQADGDAAAANQTVRRRAPGAVGTQDRAWRPV